MGWLPQCLLVGIMQVETKDALLHAINEQYVEAVEVRIIIMAILNLLNQYCHYYYSHLHGFYVLLVDCM